MPISDTDGRGRGLTTPSLSDISNSRPSNDSDEKIDPDVGPGREPGSGESPLGIEI